MKPSTLTIETLWQTVGFTPNSAQRDAILHLDGPLYMPAGPGSGKTRVLLWRTLNLIVFHGVEPEEIFLSTFTEKAALQLQEGLRALLGMATNYSGVPYDISKMYVGTVHSLCQRLIADRRFAPNRQRVRAPILLDQLSQYFYLSRRRNWSKFTAASGFNGDGTAVMNAYFSGRESLSRHNAVQSCLSLFNRLSEECLEPAVARECVPEPVLSQLVEMYAAYKVDLATGQAVPRTDFALLQQQALATLANCPHAGQVFKYVIVDEYQDTNTIQERLFFKLAEGSGNLCVVGDDDQALYRFRGATVENFVEFPQRCQASLGMAPRKITLATNYRSRQKIVEFYTDFITRCDWRKNGRAGGFYRVADKDIRAHSGDPGPAVVASTATRPEEVCAEIAHLVRRLIEEGKVEDPNQVAFLFPSLKSTQVGRMKQALENEGLLVYAPRAGRFLEVEEAVAVFGVFLHVFGQPERQDFGGSDYNGFHDWLEAAYLEAERLLAADARLRRYVHDLNAEITTVLSDYEVLLEVAQTYGWDLGAPYDINQMKGPLQQAAGLSQRARRIIGSPYFERIVRLRMEENTPFPLNYIINRATSLDWNILDLFYRICGFDHFKRMFDLAESGKDEGPVCNLGLISQYLARFMDDSAPMLIAELLAEDKFQRWFISSYLYALFRLGESEYEDAEDPFPRGRIPFLTIHQAKGLEFPVVVLANPRKTARLQRIEEIVQPLLEREGEPLDRSPEFDVMRMFYVALSRAKNLLVIAHYNSQGNYVNEPFKKMLHNGFPRIPGFDIGSLPAAALEENDLSKNYSYTGDYLLYRKCPRQYMIFRKYGFVPSRSQTMAFGSLVHRTLEDLHQFLIARRENGHQSA